MEPEEGGLDTDQQTRIEVRPWVREGRVRRERSTAAIRRGCHRRGHERRL
jgi:hypothetical protein